MSSAKLFTENDNWGDSSNNSSEVIWSFKAPKVKISKKEKKAKKRTHSAIEEDPNAGKFVRAPKFYGLEDSDEAQTESPVKEKKKKLKRKHDEVDKTGDGLSDGITPEKKQKKQVVPAPVEPKQQPTSYADQLRENLKGSRFRFLNEQLYKQTGEESMKTFKDDDTAFTAYHEGYRYQVQQWPLNPLDRIIKSLKKL